MSNFYTIEVWNAGKWNIVHETQDKAEAEAEYEKQCKVWSEVRLQYWN